MEPTELLIKHKNTIISSVILVIAIIVSLKIYSKQTTEFNSLFTQKEAETAKNVTLTKISEQFGQLAVYKEFINVKEISSVLDVISEIAKESGVDIMSIRPESEQSKDIYIRYPYVLNVVADTYHKIGDFISRLESHPDIFSVENISMSPQRIQGEKAGEQINASLTIGTIIVK
jgi:Tfp pilus assembly protein PilO